MNQPLPPADALDAARADGTSAPGAASSVATAPGGAAAGGPSTAAQAAVPSLTVAQIRVVLIGVILAMFLGALDQTIVVTALPTIGREMQSVETLSWVVTAYLLTATAATPIYGKLSDIHGRRAILMIAIAIFLVGSVACALATDLRMLILARALQGAGGGGLISLGQTIVADIIPPRERGRYMAYFAGIFMTASIAGPALGGILAEHLHWSFIFWINLPLGIAALVLTNHVLKIIPQHHRPHSIDYAGAVLMLAATFALMLALSWGGAQYAWSSLEVLGLLAAAAVLWAAFGLRLTRAAEPFVPVSLLANRIVSTGIGAVMFAVGTMVAMSVFLPLYYEAVFGLTAAQSGLALIANMAGTVVGAQIAGRFMGRTGRYKLPAIVGLAVAAVVAFTMAFAPPLDFVQLEVLIGLLGMGLGVIYPISTVSVQNAVPAHQMGTATGILNFARSLGGALVVPAFGAVFLAGAATVDGQSVQDILLAGAPGPDHAGAFRSVFFTAGVAALIACAFMATIPELPLRGHQPAAE